MKRTVGIGPIASLLLIAAVATASPPAFELRIEITSPAGEDLGRPRIKTILNSETTLEYMRAGQILSKRCTDPTLRGRGVPRTLHAWGIRTRVSNDRS